MITVIKKGSSAETVRAQYRKHKKGEKKKSNIRRLCDTITLEKDPLELQREWRDEMLSNND